MTNNNFSQDFDKLNKQMDRQQRRFISGFLFLISLFAIAITGCGNLAFGLQGVVWCLPAILVIVAMITLIVFATA